MADRLDVNTGHVPRRVRPYVEGAIRAFERPEGSYVHVEDLREFFRKAAEEGHSASSILAAFQTAKLVDA